MQLAWRFIRQFCSQGLKIGNFFILRRSSNTNKKSKKSLKIHCDFLLTIKIHLPNMLTVPTVLVLMVLTGLYM